jgi:hypothetical protein
VSDYNQAAWWNQPLGSPTAPPTTSQNEQQAPPPRSLTADDVIRLQDQRTNDYVRAASVRKGEYEAASAKFQSDKELAPYFGAALSYFTEQEGITPQASVQELFDRTVRHVRTLKGMGLQPPPQQQRRGQFLNHTGDSYLPSSDLYEQGEQRRNGFSQENPQDKMQRNQKYLLERKMALDIMKNGTDNGIQELIQGRINSALNGGQLQLSRQEG